MDLPTPGSPASSTAAPGTMPAAEHPVELGDAAGAGRGSPPPSTSPIGTAGVLTGPAAVRPWAAAASATLPQAWHSPQRPTHLPVSQPHSEQR